MEHLAAQVGSPAPIARSLDVLELQATMRCDPGEVPDGPRVAMHALARLGPAAQAAEPRLRRMVSQAGNRRYAVGAIWVLGKLGHADVPTVTALVERLEDDDASSMEKIAILQALCALGSDASSAAESLEPFLAKGKRLRFSACGALSSIDPESKRWREILEPVFTSGGPYGYQNAFSALRWGQERTRPSPALAAMFLDLLDHRSPRVRQRIADGLRHFAIDGLTPRLEQLRDSDGDDSVRRAADNTLNELDRDISLDRQAPIEIWLR